MKTRQGLTRDLVLVGGGHALVQVVKALGMSPIEGVRVTLVSPSSVAPYSGMLPGFLHGDYTLEELHIDLAQLCLASDVRFVRAKCVGLDVQGKSLELIDATSGLPRHLPFDACVLNTGATPDLSVPGALEHSVPVKPIAQFVKRWERLQAQISDAPLAVVGGGVGGVEIAAAAARRLRRPVHLLTGKHGLIPSAPEKTRQAVARTLARLGIQVHTAEVSEVRATGVVTERGEVPAADVLWNTQARGPDWLAASGLARNSQGFVEVEPTLQVRGVDGLFAVGDLANIGRPKAGVFAVRAGPILVSNLRRYFANNPLRPWKPQRSWLALINLGEGDVYGFRGSRHLENRWLWPLKDRIDRGFMAQFVRAPQTLDSAPLCLGCGGKSPPQVLSGSPLGRDAAVFEGRSYTLDTLTDPLGDPFVHGRLTALHARSDLEAAGAVCQAHLQSLAVADHDPRLQQRDADQTRAGVETVDLGVNLGGHTWIGSPPSLSLTLVGSEGRGALRAPAGSRLWARRPLGSGLLLAGYMQGRVAGVWVDQWLASTNEPFGLEGLAAPSAVTDITGFGLVGHALSLVYEGCGIDWSTPWPALEGLESVDWSTRLGPELQAQYDAQMQGLDSRHRLLGCDPQTLGGPLVAWPDDYRPPAPWYCVGQVQPLRLLSK